MASEAGISPAFRKIIIAIFACALLGVAGWLVVAYAPQRATETTLHAWGGGLPIDGNAPRAANVAPTPDIASQSAIDAPARPLAANDEQPRAETDTYASFFARAEGSVPHNTSTANVEAQIRALFSAVPNLPNNVGSAGAPARTPEQDVLFAYGNAAGSVIKGFDQTHPDEQDVLAAQANDRRDSSKAAALRTLATDLGAIGDRLRAIPHIPSSADAANSALANSYQEIGAKLALVADAGADDAKTLEAINTYNAAAGTFAVHYRALMDVFALAGVTFTNSDSGSVFTFSFSDASTVR